MNRAQLIEKIAAEHEMTKAAAGRVLDTVFSSIITAVKKGEDASFLGFGTFKQVKRAARKGFNPVTREPVKVAASKVPKFTAGAAFKAAVDPKAAARKAAKKAA